jgi:hypothetical protein
MGDLVITPALGVAWMVSEDVIDAQILKRMDGQQIVLRNTLRFLLNPSRGPRGELALVSHSRRRSGSSRSWRALSIES